MSLWSVEGASLLSDSDLDLLKPWTLGSPCEVGGGKGRILITTSEKRCEFGRVERRQKPLCLLLRVFILVFQNLGLLSKFRSVACQAAVLAQFLSKCKGMYFSGTMRNYPYSLKFHSLDSSELKHF